MQNSFDQKHKSFDRMQNIVSTNCKKFRQNTNHSFDKLQKSFARMQTFQKFVQNTRPRKSFDKMQCTLKLFQISFFFMISQDFL